MTLDEFLEKLEKTPRDWRVTLRWIRRGTGQCPISCLTETHCSHYLMAAKASGIEKALADQIARAADATRGYDPNLRAKLLKACGLEGA